MRARTAHARSCSRRPCSSSRPALVGAVGLADDRDLLHQRAHLGLDRRRDLRVRRQLGRALVRAHQLLRGRRVGGRRALGARARRSPRRCRTSSTSSARRRSGTSRRSLIAARRGRRLRARRRASADAPLGARGRASRPSPCSEITNNILRYYEKIGPGLNTFSSVPETTDLLQAAVGALLVIVAAFAYQRSRLGRQLRATREDPAAARAVGVSIYRQRLASFALSGFLAGFAGGLYIHFIPINVDAVYLDLTFITLAMLVIGGTSSLWGAVVGALSVSALDSVLAENGGRDRRSSAGPIDVPAGSRIVVVSAVMALVLIVRPSGLPAGASSRFRRLAAQARGGEVRVCVVGCGAVGSLFAANLAQLDDVEVWAYDVSQAHVDAINARGLRLTGAGEVARLPDGDDATRRRFRRATSGSSRRRRCTRTAPSPPTAHAFADGAVATVQNGVGNEEVVARHVARVIRGTTFPAGKILEPGVVQWDVKGDTTLGPFEPQPAAVEDDRAARGRVHARGDADRGRRGRASGAVAQGDLQRGDEPRRRADRAHARARVRAAGPARARQRARRRGQGGRRGAGHRARRRSRGADRPRRAARRRVRPQGEHAPGRRGPAGDRDRLPERRHRAASAASSACRRR